MEEQVYKRKTLCGIMELKLLDKEIEEDMPEEIRLIRKFYFEQKDTGCKNGRRDRSK